MRSNQQSAPQRSHAVCSSDSVITGGLGVRFEVTDKQDIWPAFVIRHSEGLAAYINRCAHLALELDWDPGLFFDGDQRHLICSTHGALYTPDTGECVGGPCNGYALEALRVVEIKGAIFLRDSRYVMCFRDSKSQG